MKQTDTIYIQGLEVKTIIGELKWERSLPQRLILDIELATDVPKAAKNDDIADAHDYAVISHRITEFITQSQFHLIETLAEQLSKLLIKEFDITWLRLKITKPRAIANAKSVGVTIERFSTIS